MSDESLFREVDEEVRQEQFKKLWARYGNAIIAICMLVVVGVAGYQGWQYWQTKQAQAAGDSFFSAAELAASGKAQEAAKQFDAIAHSGYRGLAQLREAAVLVSEGKTADAVKIYDAIAADTAADATLRDLAQLRAAVALADTSAFADIEARLKPFDAAGNPWRHVARETKAAVQWRLKDYPGAAKQVDAILADPETPPNVRQRAQMLSELLKPLVPAQ